MIITSLIIFYLASCYGSYKFVQVAHSKGGRWEMLTPNIGDVIMIFLPIINILMSIDYLKGRAKRDYKGFDGSTFFKVKK